MQQLLECLSIEMESPNVNSLKNNHSNSHFTLSYICYPAVKAESLRAGNIVRNPAHSDMGTLTLLFLESSGLEIADMRSSNRTSTAEIEKTATFLQVDPVPGTIIVNGGYLLKKWSEGRLKSAVHRVSLPSQRQCEGVSQEDHSAYNVAGDVAPERMSVAFFSAPDPDITVKDVHVGSYLARKRGEFRGTG